MTKTRARPTPTLAKPQGLLPIAYDLAYGADSAAQPGMVMMRISREGTILTELNMVPEDFLMLAHSIETVARAVSDAVDKR